MRISDFVFRLLTDPGCLWCGQPLLLSNTAMSLCPDCFRRLCARFDFPLRRKVFTPEGLGACIAPFSGEMRYLLELYKLHGHRDLAHLFAFLLNRELAGYRSGYCIVTVPCCPINAKKRGWDQMAVIAGLMKKDYGFSVASLLKRRGRAQQKELNRPGREKNAEKAFFVPKTFSQEKILLLDDIRTTGWSLASCSSVLKQSGAREIVCFTLSRAQ
jgi:ComF family protein